MQGREALLEEIQPHQRRLANAWQHLRKIHSGNPAATRAADRLKAASEGRRLTSSQLDTKFGELELTAEWMEQQGGSDAGYEQVRAPRESDEDYFKMDFELGSAEHTQWLSDHASQPSP